MNNEINTRLQALLLIDNERNRQDAKWGEQNHEPAKWVGILGEEFGEYCQAVNETVFDNGPAERLKGGGENMIRELTHVAAVAVGAIECLLRAEQNKASCEISRTEPQEKSRNCSTCRLCLEIKTISGGKRAVYCSRKDGVKFERNMDCRFWEEKPCSL